MKYAIVTGGGTGLGRALALLLSMESDIEVLIIGRRLEKLEEVKSINPDKIHVVQADISKKEGRETVFSAIPRDAHVAYLVHNACKLETKKLIDVTEENWDEEISTNLKAPFFLTQKLIPCLRDGGRILHISSGFAHRAGLGVGMYCIAKAALHMLYLALKQELVSSNIHVGSLSPGLIDTNMQETLRNSSSETFPLHDQFVQFQMEGRLQSPIKVATFVREVLLNTLDEDFSVEEWQISNPKPSVTGWEEKVLPDEEALKDELRKQKATYHC